MLPSFAGISAFAVLGVGLSWGAIKAVRAGGWRQAAAMLSVLALGATAAWPFFFDQATGTGEAYNYQLAVADAVTQMRSGEFPTLVGQTEYAYNGRVHPLRTAPYFAMLARAIDVASGGRQGAWLLQNLSLAFSLMLGVATVYGTLRWATRCSRRWSLVLGAVYGLGPPLLAAAYGMDLYMTVYVAPFVPLALGAAIRPAFTRAGWSDLVLGIALGLAWWAHPPVALWTSVLAVALRGLALLIRFSWRSLGSALAGGFAGAALAGFAFVSVLALGQSVGSADPVSRANYVAAVMDVVRVGFPECLMPVSHAGNQLGDFQLGYAGWALLVVGITMVAGTRTYRIRWHRRKIAGALLLAAILLLVLTLPIPGLTVRAWRLLPSVFFQLTNIWPMQRVYLPALAAVVLAVGVALPAIRASARRQRSLAAWIALAAIGAVILLQARPFLRRGMQVRQTAKQTAHTARPTNRDITVTSYAMLGLPLNYTEGVVEPWTDFRLLRNGDETVADNYAAALAGGRVVGQGRWLPPPVDKKAPPPPPVPLLRLDPGKHYLLTFHWTARPPPGLVAIFGRVTDRQYRLWGNSGPAGFGVEPGQRNGIAISAALSAPEQITVRYVSEAPDSPPAQADFALQEVSPEALPVVVHHWLPLSLKVNAPGPDCFVETPQRFAPGYVGLVNGHPALTLASSQGNVMVAVPEGQSDVTITFREPPEMRTAFRVSATAAGFCGLLGLAFLIFPATLRRIRVRLDRVISAGAIVATALLLAGGAVSLWQRPSKNLRTDTAAGPLRLEFKLPHGLTGRRQPVLAGGKPREGNIVYFEYTDAAHVRVSMEIWGKVYRSMPVLLDYSIPHELVISAGMLHPLTAPAMKALPSWQQRPLRDETRIELDGRTVLAEKVSTFDAAPGTVTVGCSRLGNSTSEAEFSGKIIRAERLPLTVTTLWRGFPLRLEGRFPSNPSQSTQPLLTRDDPGGTPEIFAVTYVDPKTVRLSHLVGDHPRLDSAPLSIRDDRKFIFEILGETGHPPVVYLDGRRVFDLPGDALSRLKPHLIMAGLNPAPISDAAARFTGTSLRMVRPEPPNASLSGAGLSGHAIRLIVSLPRNRTGVSEPLLSTGETGRGDLLYLVYADEGHVRFGYDHWSVGGETSAPIPCTYGDLHFIEIVTGSLVGETSAPAPVQVRLDGEPVWISSGAAYPTLPASIAVGENRIQGSTCVERFTGRILDVAPVVPPVPETKNRIANPPSAQPTSAR